MLAAALLIAAPNLSLAQTFDEAVRTNVAIATRLCLSVMIDRAGPRDVFEAAAFVYREEDRGTNDFGVDLGSGHYFDAPADTVHVEVPDPDAYAGICTLYTMHLDEAALIDVVSEALFPMFPAAQVRTEPNFSLMIETASGLPLILQTFTVERHRYEAPGTVQLSMSYPG
jgi:hypothetical protein